MNLSKHIRVSGWAAAQTESTTINSHIVDMQGFEGCQFVAVGSSVFGASTGTITVQGGTANSTSGMVAYQGNLSVAVSSEKSSERLIAVDLYKPTKRYNRLQINASSGGHIVNILAIQYGARRPGSTYLHSSTTLAGSTMLIGTTS